MRKIRLLALGYWLGSIFCGAQEIRSVTVKGSWGGLGTPRESQLTLRPSNDEFLGGGLRVKRESIDNLVTAIREEPLGKPSAANLGIDEAWLRAHVEIAGRNASMLWFDQGTPAQKQFFAAKFTEMSTLQNRLELVYGEFHTDDYPGMSVVVTFADGSSITAKSHSQNPLMLPWDVAVGNKTATNYNAHISSVLFSILPRRFTNRDRLHDDDGLGAQMGQNLSGALEREWNMIGVQDKDPDSLNKLRQNFTIRYADINTWNDVNFNEVPNEGKTVDENLQVILWHKAFPQNLSVEAHLLRKDGTTQGVDELSTKADQYASVVLSVGWLRKFLETHPKENAIISYVHGVSLTDKALRIFSSDMRATGHPELIERVTSVQSEATLLVTGAGDWWVVLPDHSMILWRWESLRPILKWAMNTFPAKRCTDYATVSGGCNGTLISPQGDIVH